MRYIPLKARRERFEWRMVCATVLSLTGALWGAIYGATQNDRWLMLELGLAGITCAILCLWAGSSARQFIR